MNALLLSEYNHLEFTDIPEPVIGPHDLLVQVKACGICGSDVHGFDGSTGRRIPPLVMGHEAAGIVTETGSEVKHFRRGDRVTFDSTLSCGHCFYCSRGEINLCDNREVLGVSCAEYRRYGAFAEFVSVPARIVYKLPDGLPFEHAAMIEAVSVAVHAANLPPLHLNDSAVVIGAGMIGLLSIQALRLRGCGNIIAVDLDRPKLEAAMQIGATHAINPADGDVPAQVHAMTNGRGADIALEAVGATQPIKTAIASVRKGGSVVLVGNVSPNIELPLQSVVSRQITLFGSCASSGEYPACIDLLARGAIKVDSLISAKAPLSEGPSWFQRLYSKEPGLTKVILEP